MALTSSPSEKFGFLFSGSVKPRYLNDLNRVCETLVKYYGYPTNKVWVVLGSDPGMTSDPIPVPVIDAYPYLKAAPRTYINNDPNGPESGLSEIFKSFALEATNPWVEDPEPTNVAFIYCTGYGGQSTSSPPVSQLDIDGSNTFAASTFISPIWFNLCLKTQYERHDGSKFRFGSTAFVHLFMQQGYGGGFLDSYNNINGLDEWSFTSACGSGESMSDTTDGDDSGSYFTLGWTNALRFVKDFSGKYADQLAPIDEVYHIQLRQAQVFAASGHYGILNQSLTLNPSWSTRGPVHYLGKVSLLIKDTPPDIKFEHNAAGDSNYSAGYENAYLFDYTTSTPAGTATTHRNDLIVITNNNGTHPVRHYRVDAAVFLNTEILNVNEPETKDYNEQDLTVILLPGNSDNIKLTGFTMDKINFNMVVARTTLTGDDIFNDAEPTVNNNNESLLAVLHVNFSCLVTHTDITATGLSDGTIKFTLSGGIPPYFCVVDGSTPVSPPLDSITIDTLTPGIHQASAYDSDIPPNPYACTVEIADPGTGPGTVDPPCFSLLDNEYLNLCRKVNNDLKFTFKRFPHIRDGYYRSRIYKIRWKSPLPEIIYPHIIPDDYLRFINMTVIRTGRDHISGVDYPYMILRVPASMTGEMLLRHTDFKWPFEKIRLEVPVSIYFKRMFGIWPWPWRYPWRWPWRWPWEWRLSWPWCWPWPWRWPWLWPWSWFQRIARFKLVVFNNEYDIIEY
jgi:hypothetical protein